MLLTSQVDGLSRVALVNDRVLVSGFALYTPVCSGVNAKTEGPGALKSLKTLNEGEGNSLLCPYEKHFSSY